MHLGDNEYKVVRIALEMQKENLGEEIAEKGASNATIDALELVKQIESKFGNGRLDLSLEETEALYTYIFMFHAMTRQMNITGGGDNESRDYEKAASNILLELGQQFQAAGIKISDFMTIHKDQQSFNNAMSRINSGTGRNTPCPCGSGKKYKHCCGK